MWYVQNRTETRNHYIVFRLSLVWEAAAKVSDFIVSLQIFFEFFWDLFSGVKTAVCLSFLTP